MLHPKKDTRRYSDTWMAKTKKALRLKCFFRGGGWTRTTELIRGQIYSLLQLPLCDSPNLSLRTCLKKTLQRYDLFLNFQQKNKLFLNIFLLLDYQYMKLAFVSDNASKKPTAVPPGYMFVATLYGIPIIGLDPKLFEMSLLYVINSGLTL